MLSIRHSDYEALRAHGEETYPNECCGVLLGKCNARSAQPRPPDRPRRQHPHRLRAQPLQHRPAGARQNPAPGPQPRPRHRRLLPLAPRPPRPVVPHRLRRSPLDRLLLRHHRRRKGQGRHHQLLPPPRHHRRRQEVPRRSHRDRNQSEASTHPERTRMNIHIPTPLRAYTDGKETVAIPGATISAVFTQLTTTYPELRSTSSPPRANSAPSSTSTSTTTTSATSPPKKTPPSPTPTNSPSSPPSPAAPPVVLSPCNSCRTTLQKNRQHIASNCAGS